MRVGDVRGQVASERIRTRWRDVDKSGPCFCAPMAAIGKRGYSLLAFCCGFVLRDTDHRAEGGRIRAGGCGEVDRKKARNVNILTFFQIEKASLFSESHILASRWLI